MDLVITIDGGAATGTSSLAAELEAMLGLTMLNSGSIYRALTWLCLHDGIQIDRVSGFSSADDRQRAIELAQNLHVEFKNGEVMMADGNCIEPIELRRVGDYTPFVGELPEARVAIRAIQRDFASNHGGVVAEGRDLGTVVFPDAIRKIFLRCDDAVRAHRRSNHEHKKVTPEDIRRRDAIDMAREESPMEPHPHALIFDTTDTSIPDLARNVVNSMRGIPQMSELIARADTWIARLDEA